MNFVATSSDALPSYSALLPITLQIWKHFGYGAIVVLHDDTRWTTTELGALVLREISGSRVIMLPTCPPLSVANTMRMGRMVAACLQDLEPSDVLVYADADYWPLAPCMCPPDPPALGHVNVIWSLCAGLKPGMSDQFGFQHACQSVQIAREILPVVVGDPVATMRGFGVYRDDCDLDQATWSHRVLTSPRTKLDACEDLPPSHHRFGELELRSWPDAPVFYEGVHPGTIIHHADGFERVNEALNLIPAHVGKVARPRFEVLVQHHPWIGPWLNSYWHQANAAADRFPW
jgi:hypothetical protein